MVEKERLKKICQVCGKDFYVVLSKKSAKYCSKVCFYISKKGKPSGLKGRPFTEEHKHNMRHPKSHTEKMLGNQNGKGHISWSKGLTKETDERLANISHTISERNIGNQFAKGSTHVPWSSGLTKETDKRLKKISENPVLLKNIEIAHKHITRISKPQKELFEILKQKFFDAQLEYPVKTNKSTRFADIGVPSMKFDFEYDGFTAFSRHNLIDDRKRDEELSEVGWATFRINKEILKKMSMSNVFVDIVALPYMLRKGVKK